MWFYNLNNLWKATKLYIQTKLVFSENLTVHIFPNRTKSSLSLGKSTLYFFYLIFSRHTVSSHPRTIRRRVINKYCKTRNVSNICFGVRTRSRVVHIDNLQWKTKKNLCLNFEARKRVNWKRAMNEKRNFIFNQNISLFNVYLSSLATLDCLQD